MKTIFTTRDQIETIARKLATELGGKMLPLQGVNSAGQTRGIAIIPATVRGEQSAEIHALAVVCEGEIDMVGVVYNT